MYAIRTLSQHIKYNYLLNGTYFVDKYTISRGFKLGTVLEFRPAVARRKRKRDKKREKFKATLIEIDAELEVAIVKLLTIKDSVRDLIP